MFNGPFSGNTRVSQHQKGKTSLGLLKQETVSRSGISWAICKSAPRASTPQLKFFTGRMPLLSPNQQRQNTAMLTDIHASTTSRPTTHRQEILSDLHHFNDAVLDMQRGVAVHLQTLLRSADVGVQLHMTQFLHPHVHLRQQLQPQPTQHHLTFI